MREGTPWSASKNKVLVHVIQSPVDTADAPTSRACAAGVMDADPLVACSGLRPDGDPEPPRRARDYWAALVPETLPQDRLDAKMVNQGQGDGNTLDVVRFARERKVLSRSPGTTRKRRRRVSAVGTLARPQTEGVSSATNRSPSG